MKNLKSKFKKICLNARKSYGTDRNRQKKPALYKRDDLTRWAKQAFDRGEDYFYVEPVHPGEPFGSLRLCDPKYGYVLTDVLTEDEFRVLFQDGEKR